MACCTMSPGRCSDLDLLLKTEIRRCTVSEMLWGPDGASRGTDTKMDTWGRVQISRAALSEAKLCGALGCLPLICL